MAEERETNVVNKTNNLIKFRHVQALLLFFGLAIAYGMRATMSVAVVAMTSEHETEDYFNWSIQRQSLVLSAFMVGYVVSHAFGRRLAARFGGKLFMVIGVAVGGIVAIFIPLGAYDGDLGLLICLRVVQGLSQGAMTPAILNLIENWIPLEERTLTKTIMLCAAHLGTSLQFLISGFLINARGWQSVFYVNTIAGVIWSIMYLVLGTSTPETSRFISDMEKEFIQNSLKQDNNPKGLKTPWYALWTSLPFLSLVIAASAQHWGLWTLVTFLPMYFQQTQDINMTQVGIVSAIPFLAMFVMVFVFRYISSVFIRRKYFKVTTTRKIFNGIGFLGPVACMITLSALKFDAIMTTVIITLAMMLNSAQYSGYMLGPEDMAPNFSNRMGRIITGFADLISIFAPLTTGMILDDNNVDDWRYVFFLTATLYMGCGVVYTVFGSSERQPWNEPYSNTDNIRSPYPKQV